MIKLTEATYEELSILLDAIRMRMADMMKTPAFDILWQWEIQILTAMQIVKDRETTNQN